MYKEHQFEKVKAQQAETMYQKNLERYDERMRALNNVDKMNAFQRMKQEEYRQRHHEIDQKVDQALARKEAQLQAKRDKNAFKADEKAAARQKHLEFDYSKREQYAQTYNDGVAKYVDRLYTEHDRARDAQHKRAQDFVDRQQE